jgi:cytochrome c oxidase subunit II
MTMFFSIATLVLIFLIIFQIAKASEYVGVLKGEETNRKQSNKINGFLMIAFLVLGLVGVYVCHEAYYGKTLFPQGSASVEGELVDKMFLWTTIATGIVFFLTQILLFWFAFKYQEKENRKAFYFPHSTKLEIIWTTVPAIVLTGLVAYGLRNWFKFTKDAPDTAQVVEITGKQFGWIYRYPGADGKFGKKTFKYINDEANNSLGLLWNDTTIDDVAKKGGTIKLVTDKNALDDIISTEAIYCVVNKPIKLIIGSRDVIHDVGLSHFRMKMDAVPGTPTTLWFTPKFTTKQMKERTGNPNFVYEISCDQMCGNGHYSMKGIVEVVTQDS